MFFAKVSWFLNIKKIPKNSVENRKNVIKNELKYLLVIICNNPQIFKRL